MKLNILRCTFSGRNVVLYYLAPAFLRLGNTNRVVVPNKDSFAIPTVTEVIPYETAPLAIRAEATEFIVCAIDNTAHHEWKQEWEEFQTEAQEAQDPPVEELRRD